MFYAKIQLLISGGIGCGVFIHSVDLAESSKNACFPLQKALKEKEEHIEQLLKERDMERSEVVRAAAQVDEVRFGRKYKSWFVLAKLGIFCLEFAANLFALRRQEFRICLVCGRNPKTGRSVICLCRRKQNWRHWSRITSVIFWRRKKSCKTSTLWWRHSRRRKRVCQML